MDPRRRDGPVGSVGRRFHGNLPASLLVSLMLVLLTSVSATPVSGADPAADGAPYDGGPSQTQERTRALNKLKLAATGLERVGREKVYKCFPSSQAYGPTCERFTQACGELAGRLCSLEGGGVSCALPD